MKKETLNHIKHLAVDILLFTLLINIHDYNKEIKASGTLQSKGKVVYTNPSTGTEELILDTNDFQVVQDEIDTVATELGILKENLADAYLTEKVTTTVGKGTTNIVEVPIKEPGRYILIGRLQGRGELQGAAGVSFSEVNFTSAQTGFNTAKSYISASAVAFVDVPESGRTSYFRVYQNQSETFEISEAVVCVIRLK